jgi:hypothetical protein
MAARTVTELAKQVEGDPALQNRMKEDPVAALREAAAYVRDPRFYRIAIVGLIGIILLAICSAVVLELWNVPKGEEEKSLPDWASTLAATAMGGLVGLFAPSPTES